MCASCGWAKRTEGVVVAIPDADVIVKGILPDDDADSPCGSFLRWRPRYLSKAAWHLVAQVNISVNGVLISPKQKVPENCRRRKTCRATGS